MTKLVNTVFCQSYKYILIFKILWLKYKFLYFGFPTFSLNDGDLLNVFYFIAVCDRFSK